MASFNPRFLVAVMVAGLAGNTAASATPDPLLCTKGKLIFEESFSSHKIDSRWTRHVGAWKVVEGALQGSEQEKDNHAASIRTDVELPEALVLQFDFRFDGGRVIHCSFNGKGHICRAMITPTGYTLRGDKVKKDPNDKTVTVGQVQQEFKAGQWYTMQLEIAGEDFVGRVDDGPVAFGAHAKIARDKGNLGFPISGVSCRIDNIKIWQAALNPEWAAIKEKLPANTIIPPVPATPKQRFALLDKNHDNGLSLEEFIGARPKDKHEVVGRQFRRKDRDNNGVLDLDEYTAGMKTR
jgi:hypothetical protein